MADIYGVTPEDVAAEMPVLFKTGTFTAADRPNRDTVIGWISDADTFIDLVVIDVTGVAPQVADKAARLAKRYIIANVKDRVIEAVSIGSRMTVSDLTLLRQNSSAKELLQAIRDLGEQAVGTGDAAPRVAVPYTTAPRDLLIDTTDLDPNSGLRGRF